MASVVPVTRVVMLDSMAVDPFFDDPSVFALAVSATAGAQLRMLSTRVTGDEVANLSRDPQLRVGLRPCPGRWCGQPGSGERVSWITDPPITSSSMVRPVPASRPCRMGSS